MTLAHPSVSRLLVWRHGRTEWNASGRFQGQLDPPLDDVGRAQARAAAAHLVASGLPPDAVVVTSDLVRAVETATALTDALGVELRVDERLREHGLGSWEGSTRDEVARDLPEQYADWMAGRPVRGRGGEDPAAVARRACAAVADLPAGSVAVVVTHGGTGGRLIESLLELGPEHRRVFGPLGNCHWTELAFQATRWRVLRHNSAAPDAPGSGSTYRRSGSDPMPTDGGMPQSADASAVLPAAGASPEEAAPTPPEDADAAS